MSQFLDELARTLAKPMPRSRAVRLFAGALVAAAVPMARPGLKGATAGSLHPATCDDPGTCSNPSFPKVCGCDFLAGCYRDCCAPGDTCCKRPNPSGTGPPCEKACCPKGTRCGDPAAGEPICVAGCEGTSCGTTCCKEGEYCCSRTFSFKAPHCCEYEDAKKDACKDIEVTTIILAIALGGAAALTGGLAAIAFAGLAAGVGLGGVGAKICGDDPPDPKYKQLFKPHIPRLAPVRAGDGITAASATALNRVIENRVRAGAYTIAWIRSIEKAQGADKGGDKTWARRHRTAAAGYARAAATAFEHDRALSTTAQKALQAAGFADTGTTLAQAKQYQRRVRVAGLPAELARALAASDVGASRISAYRTAITRLDPKLVVGVGIFGNVTDPRLAEANTKLIKALRLSARTLAKG
jgi:hypothetical protein